MRLTDRNRIVGTCVAVAAVCAAVYYVVWVFGSPWMTDEVIGMLHLPSKETGVWLGSCIMATLIMSMIAVMGMWFCLYASSGGRVPPPPTKAS